MPGRAQERDQHGSDVAAVTRDEDSHCQLLRLSETRLDARGGTTEFYEHRSCDRMPLIQPETAGSPIGHEERPREDRR